jgi:2-hydroxychromene-2-carboxylate isomerase
MAIPRLEFWFEFASTYSYLSAGRIVPLAASSGVAIDWRPFLLGPIFREQGWNDSPFNLYAAKGRYMWRDMERCCAAYGLPFRRPSRFPRNGLLAARIACRHATEAWCPHFVQAVYELNFAADRDISDAALLSDILTALGQPAAEVLGRAQKPQSKELLRRQTEGASRRGVFGAPSFVVGGELFWGNDRLEQAIAWALQEP